MKKSNVREGEETMVSLMGNSPTKSAQITQIELKHCATMY